MPFVGFENTTQHPISYSRHSPERIQEFAQHYGNSEEANPRAATLSPWRRLVLHLHTPYPSSRMWRDLMFDFSFIKSSILDVLYTKGNLDIRWFSSTSNIPSPLAVLVKTFGERPLRPHSSQKHNLEYLLPLKHAVPRCTSRYPMKTKIMLLFCTHWSLPLLPNVPCPPRPISTLLRWYFYFFEWKYRPSITLSYSMKIRAFHVFYITMNICMTFH